MVTRPRAVAAIAIILLVLAGVFGHAWLSRGRVDSSRRSSPLGRQRTLAEDAGSTLDASPASTSRGGSDSDSAIAENCSLRELVRLLREAVRRSDTERADFLASRIQERLPDAHREYADELAFETNGAVAYWLLLSLARTNSCATLYLVLADLHAHSPVSNDILFLALIGVQQARGWMGLEELLVHPEAQPDNIRLLLTDEQCEPCRALGATVLGHCRTTWSEDWLIASLETESSERVLQILLESLSSIGSQRARDTLVACYQRWAPTAAHTRLRARLPDLILAACDPRTGIRAVLALPDLAQYGLMQDVYWVGTALGTRLKDLRYLDEVERLLHENLPKAQRIALAVSLGNEIGEDPRRAHWLRDLVLREDDANVRDVALTNLSRVGVPEEVLPLVRADLQRVATDETENLRLGLAINVVTNLWSRYPERTSEFSSLLLRVVRDPHQSVAARDLAARVLGWHGDADVEVALRELSASLKDSDAFLAGRLGAAADNLASRLKR